VHIHANVYKTGEIFIRSGVLPRLVSWFEYCPIITSLLLLPLEGLNEGDTGSLCTIFTIFCESRAISKQSNKETLKSKNKVKIICVP
jgi:hypothetical protein